MRFRARFLFLLLALAALLPGVARVALAQAGLDVEAIEFEGNRRYSAESVRQTLRSKVGQKFDRALLNEDITSLYQFFDTVEVRETTTAEGVRILFVVTENPLVTEVVFQGVDELSELDLRKEISTSAGLPLADHKTENDVNRLVRRYRTEGFHFVQVEVTSVPERDGRKVIFTVFEGPAVSVDQIVFKGNDSIQEAELEDAIATKEAGFLKFLGGSFVEQTLLRDILTLKNYYRHEGWLSAEVRLESLEFTEDREDVVITIEVIEGVPFKVGATEIRGAETFPGGAEALRPLLRVTEGRRRRMDDVRKSIDALEEAYREEGFASVVVGFSSTDSPEGISDLAFEITEREKVHVRKVDILGNTITRDKVIRREVSLLPGGVLNSNEIRKSENRLKGLGYFPNVEIRVVDLPEGEDPDLKDVEVEVDDSGRTGRVRFAVGFSSDLGAVANLAVTKRNFDWTDWPEKFSDILSGKAFTGAGQTFSMELAPGEDYSAYRLAFTEPWLFDKPITFGWDLFLTKFQRFDYDVDREGLNFTLGRRWRVTGKTIDTVYGITGTTRLEKVDVSNIDPETAPTAFLSEGDNSLIAERLTFKIDRTDRADDPSSGWYAQVSTEYGFAGDIQLWKNELEAKAFWEIMKDDNDRSHILSVGGRTALVDTLGGSETAERNLLGTSFVPVYEKYFAGGGSSASAVRGFEYGGVGPHGEGDPFFGTGPAARRQAARTAISILENDGDPMGGNLLFVTSAEYTFPLYEDALRGVLFVDGGMVRDSYSRSHGLNSETEALKSALSKGTRQDRRLARRIDFDEGDSFFSDIRVAVGFGIRIKIPFLGPQPVALDFGFPIRYQDGDDRQVLSFSIARDF